MTMGKLLARRGDLALFAEAVLWLGLATLAIRLLPFKRLSKLLAPRLKKNRLGGQNCPQRVRWAVAAAARRLPWPVVCFHQGIAVQRMLCRRGIRAELRYGVGRNNSELAAHVWVSVDDAIIIGGETAVHFVEIATFLPR